MKTVTQKVFGFLYKTCLANPGGIPSPTTIQRAFAVGTPTEDLTAATFEPDKEQQPEGFLIIPLTSGDNQSTFGWSTRFWGLHYQRSRGRR